MAGGAQPKDQNAKLKQELLILAKACDDALIKEMERRNNRAKEAHKDDDPDLIGKQILFTNCGFEIASFAREAE